MIFDLQVLTVMLCSSAQIIKWRIQVQFHNQGSNRNLQKFDSMREARTEIAIA
jgi:hypothetical protein